MKLAWELNIWPLPKVYFLNKLLFPVITVLFSRVLHSDHLFAIHIIESAIRFSKQSSRSLVVPNIYISAPNERWPLKIIQQSFPEFSLLLVMRSNYLVLYSVFWQIRNASIFFDQMYSKRFLRLWHPFLGENCTSNVPYLSMLEFTKIVLQSIHLLTSHSPKPNKRNFFRVVESCCVVKLIGFLPLIPAS